MITQKEISALLHQPVYGDGGQKIGEAKHVFYDDATGRPEWVTVKMGMFGSSESFVPVRDAVVTEGHLKVPYSKDKIKGAPNVDIDAKGHMAMKEEHRLYDFYGLDASKQRYAEQQSAEKAGRRAAMGQAPGRQAAGGQTSAQQPMAQRSTAQQPMEQQSTAQQSTAQQSTAQRSMERQSMAQRSTERQSMAQRSTAQRAPQQQPAAPAAGMTEAADAMTRSEETMHVRVERHEAGRARLRKFVETEEQQQTVPVRHEEVRLVREPITEANRGDALSGPEISEAESVVILHEETPVVETTVEPKERIRLAVEERTEQQTIRGRVRKEQIKLEDATDDSGTDRDNDSGGDYGGRR